MHFKQVSFLFCNKNSQTNKYFNHTFAGHAFTCAAREGKVDACARFLEFHWLFYVSRL